MGWVGGWRKWFGESGEDGLGSKWWAVGKVVVVGVVGTCSEREYGWGDWICMGYKRNNVC